MKTLLHTILLLALPTLVHAQTAPQVLLQDIPSSVSEQQQFYVDVAITANDADFNGVQGDITFPADNITFIRAETGSSVISKFIDQPSLDGSGHIHFSGIIIGGFAGLINPFDQSHKLPGQMVRLVFEGKQPGTVAITSSNVSITDNDGKGTVEQLPDVSDSFVVTDTVAPSVYSPTDTIPPTLSASVVSDKDLYDGQYTLIFTATDKQSGVDHVELREGDGAWSTVQSPYVLHDQSRRAILSLRAYDVAGNVTTITIPPLASNTPSAVDIIVLVIALGSILYVIYKKTSRHTVKDSA